MAWTFTPDENTDFKEQTSADLQYPPDDVNTIFRVTDKNALAAYDPDLKEYRELVFDKPVDPQFIELDADGILDFRTMPDLTTLGVRNVAGTTVSPTEIVGEISGTLDATDGLKLTEAKPAAWSSVLSFRKLGAATDSGKTFSFVSRASGVGTCYNMLGLMGLNHDVDEAKYYQAYSLMTPAIYYNTSSGGRLYRPYLGVDSSHHDVVSVPFLNAANATGYLTELAGKWWRASISGMGTSGAVISVTEIDPTAAASANDLFESGVEVGDTLTRTLGWNYGTTAAHSCFAMSIHSANAGYDVMAVKIA